MFVLKVILKVNIKTETSLLIYSMLQNKKVFKQLHIWFQQFDIKYVNYLHKDIEIHESKRMLITFKIDGTVELRTLKGSLKLYSSDNGGT